MKYLPFFHYRPGTLCIVNNLNCYTKLSKIIQICILIRPIYFTHNARKVKNEAAICKGGTEYIHVTLDTSEISSSLYVGYKKNYEYTNCQEQAQVGRINNINKRIILIK